MDSPALEIHELRYAYPSNWSLRRVDALKGISLTVERGESFGFLGHNGAGKTTTIKCILGLIRPTAGAISIFGVSSRDTAARRAVGYLPENPYFYDHLTVHEIATMYAHLAGVPAREVGVAVDRALNAVKVSARRKTPMRSLSKGLTQRVALAQAIVADPQLLILDEPFSGLDPIGRHEFKEIFSELRAAGTTIFMSSHILEDVEFLCDRVSIMVHGELRGVFQVRDIPQLGGGSYELVVRNPHPAIEELIETAAQVERGEKFVRCSFGSKQEGEEAIRTALLRGIEIDSFQFVQDDLEDLFVRLVQFDEQGRGTR